MDMIALILAIIALAAASKRAKPDETVERRLHDLSVRIQYLELRAANAPAAPAPAPTLA